MVPPTSSGVPSPSHVRRRFPGGDLDHQVVVVLAAVFVGSGHALVRTLRDAERDGAAATCALELLDSLPTLPRRKLLSMYAAVHKPKTSRGQT